MQSCWRHHKWPNPPQKQRVCFFKAYYKEVSAVYGNVVRHALVIADTYLIDPQFCTRGSGQNHIFDSIIFDHFIAYIRKAAP